MNANGDSTGPTTAVFVIRCCVTSTAGCSLQQRLRFTYSREIEFASNDNRAVFRIANHLLGRKCGSVLPLDSGGPTAVANRFADHFVDKLSLIHSRIQSTPAGGDNTQACIAPSFLLSFQPATLSDVMALINSGKTKSSKFDPLPIALLKANIAALAPFFVNLINMSYTYCTVPASLKQAVVTPLLKRPGLPTDNYSNYRPISNLPYVSKLPLCHVSAQLCLHLQNNNIEDPFQSAYRPTHSVETAIVFTYRTTCCDRWTLVSTLYFFT